MTLFPERVVIDARARALHHDPGGEISAAPSGFITDSQGAPAGVTIRRGTTICTTAKRVLRTYLHSDGPPKAPAATSGSAAGTA